MVRRDVQQDGDIEGRRLCQVELIGRQFQNDRVLRSGGSEAEYRRAEIAADLYRDAGSLKHVMDQRRGGRFAVCPCDADQRRAVVVFDKQFDVADDLSSRGAGAGDDRMGRRVRQRDAGAEHQRGNAGPVRLGEIGQRNVLIGGFRAGVRIVVPCRDSRPAGHQRTRSGAAGAAESEDRHVLRGTGCHGDHFCRSTSVSGWQGR